MSAVVDFPVELLCEVFGHLGKSDLKQASLVCRSWGKVTGLCLFKRVFLSPRRQDVEVFEALSASSRCSEGIKLVDVHATFLDPTLMYPEYAKALYQKLREDFGLGMSRHLTLRCFCHY